MSEADPQNTSPPDPSGGSSSVPEQTSQVEVIDGKCVLEIKPALVYDSKGEVVGLPDDTIKAVHDFVVAKDYRREGAHERAFMYSLGVSTVPLVTKDEKHKYFCLATAVCRQNQTVVPCKRRRLLDPYPELLFALYTDGKIPALRIYPVPLKNSSTHL